MEKEEKFATRLQELRLEKKMTQVQMAEFLDLSIRAYENYEHSVSLPPFKKLIKLADFFDVSLDYLVARSDFRARK